MMNKFFIVRFWKDNMSFYLKENKIIKSCHLTASLKTMKDKRYEEYHNIALSLLCEPESESNHYNNNRYE